MTDSDDWIGTKLSSGRYLIQEKLGEGGMGAVYRARDYNLQADVVIKVPKRALLESKGFRERFERETRSLILLSHPHIVAISDVGTYDEVPFVVMSYLVGGDLKERQLFDPDGNRLPMPPNELRFWLPAVAEALDFIHECGYVHRDVKPANILFDGEGHAYLSDFGVARLMTETIDAESVEPHSTLTETGAIVGTPEYMAPELIMGAEYDGRVDQYALAVTVFQWLSGRLPFEGAARTAILVKHATDPVPVLSQLNPNISDSLATAVAAGLAKAPSERYADCRTFADSTLAALDSDNHVVMPISSQSTIRGFLRTSPRLVAFASAAVVAILLMWIIALIGAFTLRYSATWRWTGIGVASFLVVAALMLWMRHRSYATPLSLILRTSRRAAAFTAGATCALTVALIVVLRPPKQGDATNEAVGKGTPHLSSPSIKLPSSSRTVPETSTAPMLTPDEEIAAIPEAAHRPEGDFTNSIGMQMLCISSGRFVSKPTRNGNANTKIVRDFWIASRETTVAQYLYFMSQVVTQTKGATHLPEWLNPASFNYLGSATSPYAPLASHVKCNGAPVVGISRAAADAFCKWLTSSESARAHRLVYELPSPDEWECAYRAGTRTTFYWGDDFDPTKGNSAGSDKFVSLSPAGRFPPNDWGLQDMAGNVWEMINTDEARGGAWTTTDYTDLSASGSKAAQAGNSMGFRVVAKQR